MTKEVCAGTSPWKGDAKTIHMGLSLVRRGIDIAEMSKMDLEKTYNQIEQIDQGGITPSVTEQKKETKEKPTEGAILIEDLKNSGFEFGKNDNGWKPKNRNVI